MDVVGVVVGLLVGGRRRGCLVGVGPSRPRAYPRSLRSRPLSWDERGREMVNVIVGGWVGRATTRDRPYGYVVRG